MKYALLIASALLFLGTNASAQYLEFGVNGGANKLFNSKGVGYKYGVTALIQPSRHFRLGVGFDFVHQGGEKVRRYGNPAGIPFITISHTERLAKGTIYGGVMYGRYFASEWIYNTSLSSSGLDSRGDVIGAQIGYSFSCYKNYYLNFEAAYRKAFLAVHYESQINKHKLVEDRTENLDFINATVGISYHLKYGTKNADKK